MRIEKVILSLLIIGIQIFIYFKEQEIILELDKEFGGLYCPAGLQEGKIIVLMIIILGYLLIKQNKVNQGIKYFIITTSVLQLAIIYFQIPIDILILENTLICFSILITMYLIYLLFCAMRKNSSKIKRHEV